jgi:hypothetical protein
LVTNLRVSATRKKYGRLTGTYVDAWEGREGGREGGRMEGRNVVDALVGCNK